MGVAYPLWWNHRSETGGHALLAQAASREGLSTTVPGTSGVQPGPGGSTVSDTGSSCHAAARPTGAGPQLPAILEIPSIGLEAPVLQGLSNPVLDEAVGHDPTSVWPGAQGTSILLAHDASYFSSLGAVHPGQTVSWIDDCQKLVFKVDSTEITQPGTAIPVPRGGVGVALITCSPSDALFWTPDRLVVLASLVSVQSTSVSSIAAAVPLGLRIPVPESLLNEGLGLTENNILVGRLDVSGTPSRAWAEGPDPLQAARLAFADLAAAEIAARAVDTTWWSAIALHGVPMPASISVTNEFDALVNVQGTSVRGITLSAPGTTVDFVVRGGVLYISGVTG